MFLQSRRFFLLFHEMSHFLQLFSEKLIKMSERDSFLEKLSVLGKSMIFHEMSHCLQFFSEKFVKNKQLVKNKKQTVRQKANMIVCSKSCKF